MLFSLMPISKNDFLSQDYIYFSDINEGFSSFKYKDLTLKDMALKDFSTKYFSEFLINEFEKSASPVYVDFYIKNLSSEDINNLSSFLNEEYKNTLISLLPLKDVDTVFFEIKDKSIIPFLTELSTKELFFTTFYFKNFTLWGNYNLTFPIFCRNTDDFNGLLLGDNLTFR